ncbi:MAG: CoA pyrophosphatase [Deltaproteobacteria bacterium]|nr:MAG: CoA pyrophosphatase [Deltaproteobacteria bacterium]
MRRQLAGHPCQKISDSQLREAAVLLILLRRGQEYRLLLTRRTDTVRHHKGEICLPGGSREPTDDGPVATALRETREELGLAPDRFDILGCLDDVESVHGYRVTPVVAWLHQPGGYRPDPTEIAEVLELPLQGFFRPGAHHSETWQHRGRRERVHFYQVEGTEVWGMTAAILRQLFSLLQQS